jgi:glyoxylase-like metal-dependent hydrolase (beta-lactamase superfamily II)
VLLRLPDRYALICGDSAMSTRELREPIIDGIVVDQNAYVRSGDEARRYMRAHPKTLAIPSHDREVMASLQRTVGRSGVSLRSKAGRSRAASWLA